MSAYYKSIHNHAVLCSTIKSSAKNQTKDCPIVQTFYILHQRYVSYYISDETYASLIDGTKIGASCKGVLHHLSCLWDIVFEGNRWLKYHERCLLLSYDQSPPEKMPACSTIAHSRALIPFLQTVCPLHGLHRSIAAKRWPNRDQLQLNVDPRNP